MRVNSPGMAMNFNSVAFPGLGELGTIFFDFSSNAFASVSFINSKIAYTGKITP
jgi:hypothetical protein